MVVVLSFLIQDTFSVIGISDTKNKAEEQALKKAYIFIKVTRERNTKQWNLAGLTFAANMNNYDI